MYDFLVFIGRFQPFHAGHYHVVQEALKQSKQVILVLGSHDRPRDSRNPFTTAERIEIITSAVNPSELERIHFAPQYDHTYNEEKWIAGIQASVNTIVHRKFTPNPIKIGIIGYSKDHSSFYLKKFPAWDLIEVTPKDKTLNATFLREEVLFTQTEIIPENYVTNRHHRNTIEELSGKIWHQISNEISFIAKYKEGWKAAPYPPIFMTVDAVVTQSGHLLVVERGAQPGEGLWALPGGFVNQNETLKEAVIRELYEETKLDIPKPALVGSIVRTGVYDDPNRSTRGRTITQAYHFKLVDRESLPRIKGSDDAKSAQWITLSEFSKSRSKFFEDHYCLVESMLGL